MSANADPVVAAAALIAIRGRADLLGDDAAIGRPGPTDSRILRVRRTPYLLFYRIAAADRIEILRVRHDRESWPA